MKQSVVNFIRALAVLVLVAPAPIAVVNAAPAMASPAEVVAAEPAVVVPETAAEETEDPWTGRYLGPIVVVVAVVAVGATMAYYVVRIRGRYRVG